MARTAQDVTLVVDERCRDKAGSPLSGIAKQTWCRLLQLWYSCGGFLIVVVCRGGETELVQVLYRLIVSVVVICRSRDDIEVKVTE